MLPALLRTITHPYHRMNIETPPLGAACPSTAQIADSNLWRLSLLASASISSPPHEIHGFGPPGKFTVAAAPMGEEARAQTDCAHLARNCARWIDCRKPERKEKATLTWQVMPLALGTFAHPGYHQGPTLIRLPGKTAATCPSTAIQFITSHYCTVSKMKLGAAKIDFIELNFWG
ncbi:hypothetical protein VTN31DRAFT_6703 [Thermomyces dupontii]|uniref:uncharacterized protein n=1 Tax=Talaromyces thermophilus TaxID=28565 RepID=UPI003744372C